MLNTQDVTNAANVSPVVTASIKDQIETVAAASFEAGLIVDIDSVLPTLSIYHKDDKESGYFFQESEADGILFEAEEHAAFYDVPVNSYLAFISQSW